MPPPAPPVPLESQPTGCVSRRLKVKVKYDTTYVHLDGPIDHQREDAVCDLWTVLRHTEKVSDIGHLGNLILSLMREVSGKQRLEGRRAGRHKRYQVAKKIMDAVVNHSSGERPRGGFGQSRVQSLQTGFWRGMNTKVGGDIRRWTYGR